MSYLSYADLGGQSGHGPVVQEPEGELFHAPWEPRVLALTLAAGATGAWNLDMARAARETLADYAKLSYYQVWFEALVKLLVARGLVSPHEIEAGKSFQDGRHLSRVLKASGVGPLLQKGSPTVRVATGEARFALGETVRTRNQSPGHHTRLPAYARGKCGVIARIHGQHIFADAHAQGQGECPEWLYTVEFDERALWGTGSPVQGLKVSIDAWEPYLEAP